MKHKLQPSENEFLDVENKSHIWWNNFTSHAVTCIKIILIEMAFESQFARSTKEAIPFWCRSSTWIMEMVHLERPFNGMFLASNKMSPPYQGPLQSIC